MKTVKKAMGVCKAQCFGTLLQATLYTSLEILRQLEKEKPLISYVQV